MIQAVDGNTKIIPGHGPLTTRDELKSYRDMLAGVNEAITKAMSGSKTLEQVQAAAPTRAYDDKWGQGFLKSPDFVRLIYQGRKG
jgi:hypothetical protein